MPRFAFFLSPPSDDAAPVSDDVLAAHNAYLDGLVDDGLLIAAGLLDNPRQGLIVFDAPDLERARAIADADPAVSLGGRVAVVRRWDVQFGPWKP